MCWCQAASWKYLEWGLTRVSLKESNICEFAPHGKRVTKQACSGLNLAMFHVFPAHCRLVSRLWRFLVESMFRNRLYCARCAQNSA